ncbi:phosphotransferase family protein [Nocardia macrotermitis]|uniref:Aminoglycoside phosphotransferase domain-containing protein n=1 Tax=Nocardia macrotermitis TaxID=2585198 RepID=A0A7K0D6Y2_9NOCA|nr:phosphotransferase family protein [Nocardia macrotermitis]MQY21477.1 hypothetical protein [Nocardia macrotermitis]
MTDETAAVDDSARDTASGSAPASDADSALLQELRDRVTYQAERWRPGVRVTDIRPLTGGTSSLTFLVDLREAGAETTVVLKVAPPGLPPVRNRDVLRQARVQRVLRGRDRPLAPTVLFSDEGQPPHSPPFMAMNFVPGECLEPILTPAARRPAPDVVHARYLDAARLLVELHRVRPESVGFADEPVITLGDEIDRWTRAFTTLPEEMRGDYERAGAALHASMPEPLPPAINHGDFRLGNTLCDQRRLSAIIDWEIWAVGDPRIDLAWLTYFTDDAGHPAAEAGPPAGTPTRDEVVLTYEQASGATLPDLDWFHALVRYKESAATGLLLKRALKRGASPTGPLGRMLPVLPALVQESLDILEARSS